MTYDITITTQEAAKPALFWSTFWDSTENLGDWRVAPANDPVNPGGLDASAQLASAVIISLFTDKRAPEGWRSDISDRRGWWGDGVAPEGEEIEAIGSHLWLLVNEVSTDVQVRDAKRYAEEALAWMVRDKVAASVAVTSGLITNPVRGVWLNIAIAGRDGALVYSQRFDRLWQELRI
jgi:phage gp46-like protein